MQVWSTQDVRTKSAKDLSVISMVQSHAPVVAERLEDRELVPPSMSVMDGPQLSMQDSMQSDELLSSLKKVFFYNFVSLLVCISATLDYSLIDLCDNDCKIGIYAMR